MNSNEIMNYTSFIYKRFIIKWIISKKFCIIVASTDVDNDHDFYDAIVFCMFRALIWMHEHIQCRLV